MCLGFVKHLTAFTKTKHVLWLFNIIRLISRDKVFTAVNHWLLSKSLSNVIALRSHVNQTSTGLKLNTQWMCYKSSIDCL